MTLRDAQQIAYGLIQGYIGPDHKVIADVLQRARAGASSSLSGRKGQGGMTDTPREFCDAFVKRSYEAWCKAPQNLMLADCAVHQANVMLERLARYENPTLSGKKFDTKVKKRRTELATANSDYQLVWDIDDAHKHLE